MRKLFILLTGLLAATAHAQIKDIGPIVTDYNSKSIAVSVAANVPELVGSSRVDLQACKLEYSIVSPK